MSFDKPGSGQDDDADKPREPRPFNPDPSKPMPDWMRDRPNPGRSRPDGPGETDRPRLPPFPGQPENRPYAEPPRNVRSFDDIRAERAAKTDGTDSGDVTDQRADHGADRVSELERELAAAKSELAAERADRRKLTRVVADQSEELKRLRAQLDQPAQTSTAVDAMSNTVPAQDRDGRQVEASTPWYKRVPGEAKVGLFTAGAGVVESVATATHGMSGSTEGIVASVIGLGVAGIAVVRDHYKQKGKERND